MSSSRGKSETEKLKSNLQDQLGRLLAQLNDLEECKADLEPADYEETKTETLEQLKEFQTSLAKLHSGNMTLVDDLNAMQLAIAAAISNAFTTPEVICMFGKKQPCELRQRLVQLDRDHRRDSTTASTYNLQRAEILMALKKLGDPLTPLELGFLDTHSSVSLREFELIDTSTNESEDATEIDSASAGSIATDKIFKMAGQHVASHLTNQQEFN